MSLVSRTRLALSLVALYAIACSGRCFAADQSDSGLVPMVLELIKDPDKEVRALGFEQVRTAAPGAEATRQFVAALPTLSPEAQVELIRALADRKDATALAAMHETLAKSRNEAVRLAAIGAVGALGDSDDVPRLVELMSLLPQVEQVTASSALVRLRGEKTPTAIADAMKAGPEEVRVALIFILAHRRARETVPQLLEAAVDSNRAVRKAAMAALGELAGPEDLPGMLQGVLKAKPSLDRDAAERAVAEVCHRISDSEKQTAPLLEAMNNLAEADRDALLPALGRVGGPAALQAVEAAIGDSNAERHEAGLRALCNWPDASMAPRLLELAKFDQHPEHRAMVLKALIRVAPLPDGRPDGARLALLKQVMSLCSSDDERSQVLKRASAIRTLESLRFVAPYMDQPAFAEQACETVVELAHHRNLREPNKAEFDRALDKVLAVSKDPTTRERAARYKKGQTWVRPKAA
jgi:HEAT repeat protein